VTVVSCPPFCDENVAALFSLLINKHGQKKGDRHLTSVELIQVVVKDVKTQKKQKMRKEEVPAKTRNIQVTILQWQ